MKEKIRELAWWAIKWLVAAAIIVGAVEVHTRLQRLNVLVDAIVNNIRQSQQQPKP